MRIRETDGFFHSRARYDSRGRHSDFYYLYSTRGYILQMMNKQYDAERFVFSSRRVVYNKD